MHGENAIMRELTNEFYCNCQRSLVRCHDKWVRFNFMQLQTRLTSINAQTPGILAGLGEIVGHHGTKHSQNPRLGLSFFFSKQVVAQKDGQRGFGGQYDEFESGRTHNWHKRPAKKEDTSCIYLLLLNSFECSP